jgi:hypothetical protein
MIFQQQFKGATPWHSLAVNSCTGRRRHEVRDSGEIERSIAAFAQTSNGGLIVTGSPAATASRDLIVKLATRHRLPVVCSVRTFVAVGGLTTAAITLRAVTTRAATTATD